MEPEVAGGGLVGLLPFFLVNFFFAIAVYMLAKDKGRNVAKWTLLALIPLVGMFAMPYFIGAANLRLEEKIDRLLEQTGTNK